MAESNVTAAGWPWMAAFLVASLAWWRLVPWPNVFFLGGGAVLFGWGWIWMGGGMVVPAWPAAVGLGAWLLASRLVARQGWAWRRERPFYGYELMALTALLAALPPTLLFSRKDWPGNLPSALGLVLLWQVLMTPWWLRKNPHPPPPDWLGPLAWLLWVAGAWHALAAERPGWPWFGLAALPALAAWWAVVAALQRGQSRT